MSSDYLLSSALIGAEKLTKALSNSSTFARQELAKALNKAANDAQNKAVEGAPKQTGRLKSSIHTQEATPNALVAKVGTNVIYSRAQEYGTQGMTIQSHSRKGTPFTYIGNIKPKLYMKGALEYVLPRKTEYLREASRRIVEHLAGA